MFDIWDLGLVAIIAGCVGIYIGSGIGYYQALTRKKDDK